MTQKEWQGHIDERLDKLDKQFSNHLAHHWAVTLSLIGALLSVSGTLLVMVLKHVLK